jgi:hypothetical protein
VGAGSGCAVVPILESKYLLGVAIALDTNYTGHVPDIDPKTAIGQKPTTT